MHACVGVAYRPAGGVVCVRLAACARCGGRAATGRDARRSLSGPVARPSAQSISTRKLLMHLLNDSHASVHFTNGLNLNILCYKYAHLSVSLLSFNNTQIKGLKITSNQRSESVKRKHIQRYGIRVC